MWDRGRVRDCTLLGLARLVDSCAKQSTAALALINSLLLLLHTDLHIRARAYAASGNAAAGSIFCRGVLIVLSGGLLGNFCIDDAYAKSAFLARVFSEIYWMISVNKRH